MNATVYRGSQAGFGNQSSPAAMLNTLGQQVVMQWLQKAVLDGNGYQIRQGTISVIQTGDGTALTDAAAEMAVDAATGTTIIPVYANIHIETPLDAGEGAIKAVSTVSSSGTAFTPLLLRPGGSGSVSTARVAQTGGVTVTGELATTTLILKRWIHLEGTTATSEPYQFEVEYRPLAAPVLDGPRCCYVQVSLDTYMAHLDYLEFVATLLTQ